jgi:low affinity Fe/Cu permease
MPYIRAERNRIQRQAGMNTTIWIVLGVAVVLVLVYLLVMRVFYRQSRALDRQIDYSKMRPWTGNDGEN